ncbi:MAG: HEAT repeat domain-containing protein [bacterium]
MKTSLHIVLILALILGLTSSVLAGATPDRRAPKFLPNRELIEKNLIIAINSDNIGLQTSAAGMLGDIQCEQAVMPLMRILKNSESERARMAAAIALYKIADARGIFTIKQAIRFDDSEKVRKVCTQLYSLALSDK